MEIRSLCAAGRLRVELRMVQTCATQSLDCFVGFVCVCVNLVFCWIALSKQVERPVVMRDTAVVWEDMRESDHSEKENAL